MKHPDHPTKCHCGLKKQLNDLSKHKLGWFGGILLIGHLLFHVAECLVLPAIFLAANGNATESSELNEDELQETTLFGHNHLSFTMQSINLDGVDILLFGRNPF